MLKVKKAVIPAAGLGTRVLPATKAMPKEMLPIVDKPAIQYIVEEAVSAGITEILIVIGRGKTLIEDHFDRSPELESVLCSRPGKEKELEDCLGIANLANIYFVRQKQALGLGHAISCAKAFTGDEPFAVLYGDDVILGEDPAAGQLVRAYEEFGKPCVAIKEVPRDQIRRYSSMQVELLKNNLYTITDMIEKPAPGTEFSLFSILGRCLLTKDIYPLLDQLTPGAGGELQLTDAMAQIARTGGMVGVDFTGTRYDMGNKLGIMQAAVETAITHPEIGAEFTTYLKEIAKNL
ncbi:UTP--glucose-1-phosphate uridylyltransferase [Ruminococcaceae bacterium OttesenSCG-928-N02]|nr:UTP--glucose-1-phosphate uridylyltransferase [Ruminococcaceae bacterium OttesenSCG-928-N02]